MKLYLILKEKIYLIYHMNNLKENKLKRKIIKKHQSLKLKNLMKIPLKILPKINKHQLVQQDLKN
jgi:hypothetical protein